MKVTRISRLLVAAFALLALSSTEAAAQFTPTLTATATGNSVVIEWTPIAGTEGYNIVVGTSPGSADLAVVNLPALFGTRIQVTAPTGTYYLRVRAYAGSLVGPFSDEVSVSPGLGACVPGSAARLTVTTNQNIANASWTPVPGATAYILQWSRFAGGTELETQVTGTSASQLVPFNGDFFVRVVAQTACGNEVSNEVQFTIAVSRRHLSPSEIRGILSQTAAAYPRAFATAHTESSERYDFIILACRALYQAGGSTIGCNWRRAVPGDLSMDGLSVENPADGRYYFADVIVGAGGPNPSIEYNPPFHDGALLRNAIGRYAPEGFANPLTLKTFTNYGPAGGW